MSNKNFFRIKYKRIIQILFNFCVIIAMLFLYIHFIFSDTFISNVTLDKNIADSSIKNENNKILEKYYLLNELYINVLKEYENILYFNDKMNTDEINNRINKINTVIKNIEETISLLEDSTIEPDKNMGIINNEENNAIKVAVIGAIGIIIVALINSGFSSFVQLYKIRVENYKTIMHKTFIFESNKGNIKMILKKISQKDKVTNEDDIMYINGKKYKVIELINLR